MSTQNVLNEEQLLECQICLMEVPVSESDNDEASDYVMHYCGLECYARWVTQENIELVAR